MTSAEIAAWLQGMAGLATFGAACVAVRASYDAPKRAAELAELLRRASQREDEDRRLKLFVFTNLMQFRAQLINPTAVASLNVIDVVYRDSREVRDAWRSFLAASEERPFSNPKLIERYLAIIEKMARALGLDSDLSVNDIQKYYYPEGMGKFDQAAMLELEEKLKRFTSGATPESPTAPPG